MEKYIDTLSHLPSFLEDYLCKDILNLFKNYLILRTEDLKILDDFEELFGNIGSGEFTEDKILVQDEEYEIDPKYAIGFHQNIKTIFYWDCNSEMWNLVGKLNNGKYFYYFAFFRYEAFNITELMDLYIAENLEYLINHKLDEFMREKFIKYQYAKK